MTLDECAGSMADVHPVALTVIAAGDATHDGSRIVAARFGAWQRRRPARDPVAIPRCVSAAPASGERLAVVHRPAAAQSELRIGHVACRGDA